MADSISPGGRPRKPERSVIKISAENRGWLDWLALVMDVPIGHAADMVLDEARRALSTKSPEEEK